MGGYGKCTEVDAVISDSFLKRMNGNVLKACVVSARTYALVLREQQRRLQVCENNQIHRITASKLGRIIHVKWTVLIHDAVTQFCNWRRTGCRGDSITFVQVYTLRDYLLPTQKGAIVLTAIVFCIRLSGESINFLPVTMPALLIRMSMSPTSFFT